MDDFHTAKQPAEDENQLSPAIKTAAAQLREKFFDQDVPILCWNPSYVAIPLTVEVELPGRGTVNGVDIRRLEPIVLLIKKASFPYIAPRVYSNRRDFPKTKFPHLNPTAHGDPAWFCLHRGSIDTWFAEHTVVDLVERARGWLRDAARNRLVSDGDGFEPTRAAKPFGTFIYTPAVNIGRIVENWATRGGAAGHGAIAFDLLDDESKAEIDASGYSVRQAADVPDHAYEQHRVFR